jgi:hypothetical protein
MDVEKDPSSWTPPHEIYLDFGTKTTMMKKMMNLVQRRRRWRKRLVKQMKIEKLCLQRRPNFPEQSRDDGHPLCHVEDGVVESGDVLSY